MPPTNIDDIVTAITTTTREDLRNLNHHLRTALPKETRETILASTLSGGQDPLTVLDPVENTLGFLYILTARLSPRQSAPPWQTIQAFCSTFKPHDARLAPDRVTQLARGIVALAEQTHTLPAAIPLLLDLVTRYPPDSSYLTTIHPIFVMTCVRTQHYTEALPVLAHPITNVDTTLSDLHYNDNLIYHYAGGVALGALKRWSEAEEFFEICVSSPGTAPAAIQLEALKKLRLVQLISRGSTSPLPKYTHPNLTRIFKSTPYHHFIAAYPHKPDQLNELVDKEKQTFTTEKTLGLILQALDRVPRWSLKKLTATYVTLSISDIGKAVKIGSEDEVRELLLSMIESKDISARISADGAVTFSDPVPEVTKAQVDRVLQDAQAQGAALLKLEKDMGRSKEYLTKALKNKDDVGQWGMSGEPDEQLYNLGAGQGSWAEEAFS